MGTYNPTNTRCQMMSYFDPGAPQCMYGSRQSFYEFLDTVLTQGFNTQAVTSLTLLNEEGKYKFEHLQVNHKDMIVSYDRFNKNNSTIIDFILKEETNE